LIPNRLKNIANSIAQHVANVSFDKLIPTRMILNLKIDEQDRAWLLWCSSLRTDSRNSVHQHYKGNSAEMHALGYH